MADRHLGQLPVGQAMALLNAHAARAERLEHRAAREASAPIRRAGTDILRWALREWVTRFGALAATPDTPGWAALAVYIAVRMAPPRVGAVALGWAEQALILGVTQGALELALDATPAAPALAGTTRAVALGTDLTVRRRYDDARRLLSIVEPEGHQDMVTALAPTQAAAGDVDRDARWATNAAVNQGLHAVAEAHDADLLWQAERDACVVCLALAGAVVGHGESFDISATFGDAPTEWWSPPGHQGPLRPPRHPRCFPAGVVTSGPPVEAATSRWYSGELVRIRVASGEVLPVTPNHPVLTTQGWIAAGLLRQGMQVVRDCGLQRVFGQNPDNHQGPSRIEQVAATLGTAGCVMTERMPVSAVDFHGDGADGYVNVVRARLSLADWGEVGQPFEDYSLVLAGNAPYRGSSGGLPQSLRERYRATAHGSVGSLGQSGSFFGACRRHADIHGGAAVAQLDIVAQEKSSYGRPANLLSFGQDLHALPIAVALDQHVRLGRMPPTVDVAPLGRIRLRNLAALLDGQAGVMRGDAAVPGAQGHSSASQLSADVVAVGGEAFAECARALSGLVAFDEIVEVTRTPFAGHVYNLETSDGWYTANGLIVHNCRCRVEPWLGGSELPAALRREAERSILRGDRRPSESEDLRIRAADRLLARGTALPITVQRRARAAIAAGRFGTRGRRAA